MNIKDAIEMEEEAHKRRMNIRSKKAHDYAKEDDDCLSNFKVMAELAEVLKKYGYSIPIDKPYGTAFWHLLHKVVRILNLWSEGKSPLNESLQDSFDDLINYACLANECYMDYMLKQPLNKPKTKDENHE